MSDKYANIKFEDDAKWLDICSAKELNRIVARGLTFGSTLVKSAVRSSMPTEIKKFKAILKHKKLRTSIPVISVGFFGKTMDFINRRGVKWDAYQLVYWFNYGTLSNRSSTHTFTNGRKEKSMNWKGGIKSLHFFETSVEGTEDAALERSLSKIELEHDKLLKKKGWQ